MIYFFYLLCSWILCCPLAVTSNILFAEQKMPEGSWKCEKCNNINYPFRTKCNRQNCGEDKPTESKKSSSPAPDENDQVCSIRNMLWISMGFLKLSLLLVIFVHNTSLIYILFSNLFSLIDPFLMFPSVLHFSNTVDWFLF